MQDTIFALSSAPGRGGVAVIRVSGPHAAESLKALAGTCPAPRLASVYTLKHPVSRETIDKALVLFFENPASFTGEDIAEYHVHGGRAVVSALLSALKTFPYHRMAEPGEFTRRAFENGKMDLTAAEAIADLIDAETEAQKMQALAQMGGALSSLYSEWSERLKRVLAHLEADIEFPDEDMPDGVAPEVLGDIRALTDALKEHLNDNRRGERLRDGVQVVVIGAPNAGKSSLVNALAQRDVAIVSDIAGTTRDVIEAHLDLGGYPVILADTAGLRPDQIPPCLPPACGGDVRGGQDSIESEGIRRAFERAQRADIKLLVFDGTVAADPHTLALVDENSVIAVNKIDQLDAFPAQAGIFPDAKQVPAFAGKAVIKLSAETGEGLNELIRAITDKAAGLIGSAETPSLTRKRHRSAVEAALEHLERALQAPLPELVAEDVRLAVRALGRITGRVDVEDLLDVIFRDFCIGK